MFKDVFEYKDGILYWKVSTARCVKVGDAACSPGGRTLNGDFYLQVHYKGKKYKSHRVIWELFNGEIPEGYQIDHIDQDKTNNRIENLRLCTRSENKINVGVRSDNSSGAKGVSWKKDVSKWQARIYKDRKCINLGYYDTIEEAAEAYRKGSLKFFPTFSPTE